MKASLVPFVLVLTSLAAPAAAAPKLAGASIAAGDRTHVAVTFDGPIADASQVNQPSHWLVLLATKTIIETRDVASVDVTQCTVAPPTAGACPAGQGVVELSLGIAAAPPELTAIEVIYRGPLGPASKTFKLTEATTSILTGAKKDEADISFSGTYVHASGEDPKYSFDTYAGYMHALDVNQIGVYGQAKTKNAAAPDPQSFLFYALVRRPLGSGQFHGPFQGAIANARGGIEFDKDGKQRNFVLSPTLVVPFRATAGTLGLISPGFTTPHGALHLGVEVVKPDVSEMEDTSVRYRALIGATLTAGKKVERPGFYGWTVKTLYEVRFLSADEPYVNPRHTPRDASGKKGDAVLEFGDQARPNFELTLGYLFAEWAGIEAKYEYGSLPPAFVLTDHTVTVGVTLTLKQTSYARYSILKP